jgi:transcriptional regulator with XRE-family HTH domain
MLVASNAMPSAAHHRRVPPRGRSPRPAGATVLPAERAGGETAAAGRGGAVLAARARLGEAIAARRHELGLTRREVAERAGLSYPYVAQLERGQKSPSSASLFALAAALEVPVADLLGEVESPSPVPGAGHRVPRPVRSPGPSHGDDRDDGDDADPEQLAALGRFVRALVRDEVAGELARQGGAPGAPSGAGPEAAGPPVPRPATGVAPEPLAARVLRAVEGIVGDDAVVVDDQGDMVVPRGPVTLFVRLLDQPPSVLVFCPVLIDVAPTAPVLARLNVLNDGVRFVRFCATEEGVVVEYELFGDGFDRGALDLACRAVAGAATRFGPELRDAFGGRLFLDGHEAAAPRPDTAGYL